MFTSMNADESHSREERTEATTIYVRRAVAHDPEAIAWLYRHVYPWVLHQARLRVKPRYGVEPEDLAQEVWQITLGRLSEIKARNGRHTPPLMRFISTVLLNLVRALRKRPPRELPESNLDRATSPDSEPPDDTPGADANVELEERGEIVRDALAVLDRFDRDLLVMRVMEGLPYKIIADRLDASAGALKTRLRTSLERLRAALPGSFIAELAAAEQDAS